MLSWLKNHGCYLFAIHRYWAIIEKLSEIIGGGRPPPPPPQLQQDSDNNIFLPSAHYCILRILSLGSKVVANCLPVIDLCLAQRAKMWWNDGIRFPENFWEYQFCIARKIFKNKLLHDSYLIHSATLVSYRKR